MAKSYTERLIEVICQGPPVLFVGNARFRLYDSGWICGDCSPELRERRWLGKSSTWAKNECERLGWSLKFVSEGVYEKPEFKHVSCSACVNLSGKVCGVGREPSELKMPVILCAHFGAK